MHTYSFRDYHLLQLLTAYYSDNKPIDVAICHYFRNNKALGSKDRAALAEAAYGLVRWQGLLEALAPHASWLERLELFHTQPWLQKLDLPAHQRVSFPPSLYDLLCASYGTEKAEQLCLICNEAAPTYVRVNTLKCSRDELLARWQDKYDVAATSHSSDGIVFFQKIHFYSLPEFQEGLFEIQDEASQLVAQLVAAEPGNRVLDYCAGAGGKALAIAPRLQQRGQIVLHDIREYALQEARQRLRRAGVQNMQILHSTSPHLASWKKKMDWVLVDAPCTGTGTLRRNPDMKWRFDTDMLERLIGQQRNIFEKALSYLKPGGHIVYATCSMLPQENSCQIEHFQQTYNLEIVGTPLQTLPTKGGMDGFFGAVLTHK
jgi:16S rRNA (cytosine967-C5)-methyltransferase